MLEVVAALIRDGERFLICQRPEGKNCALGWEFPGGKLEAGETGAQALARECREELDIDIEVLGALADVQHVYPSISIHLTLMEARIASGVPRALEHADIRWITAAQLGDFELCPADRRLVDRLDMENAAYRIDESTDSVRLKHSAIFND